MLKRRGFLAAISGVALLVMSAASPVLASKLEDKSSAFITSLTEKAISSLTAENADRNQRIKLFRAMFNENFAVRSIGKFVLGRYWNRASEEERREYQALFEDLMIVSYVDRFTQYAGEKLRVQKARGENETTATIFTLIERPGGAKAIRVNWRVGTNGTIFKVLDVIVEGTSMSITLKSDFASIIRRKGGKVAGLIEELRTKTAELKAK